jgi:hypothetical protein
MTITVTAVPDEMAASVQHLELIGESIDSLRAKIARLEVARTETLRQIAAASKRAIGDRRWGREEMFDLYEALNTPGFFTAWNAAGLPHPARLRAEVEMARRNAPNDLASGGWLGEFDWEHPIGVIPSPHPPNWTPVVYVLYAPDAEPVYCGSTEHFKQRLKAHHREGKRFAAWRASPCADREQAYILEDRLLKQSCPPLNRKASR